MGCPTCSRKVNMLIGKCKYCSQTYCASHRLPEQHQCENIKSCKEEHYIKNKERVLNEKCVGDKIIKIE